ncbi:MAG: cytidylyltransferase domain-containing protein [Nitrosarchaeum sp.]
MKQSTKFKKSPCIAAVIPCRVYSTRLLAKPLQRIGNFTILELLIKQLKKSKRINEIVLAIAQSTGKDLFVEFAKKHKIKFVIGDEIDVLGRLIKGAKKVNADILFRTTSENPFIYWEGIDNLIKNHVEGNFDLSFYGSLPLGASYEIITLKSLKFSHTHGTKKYRSEYSTLYIYENPKKFKINRIESEKFLQRPDFRLTVDTPQDLWVVRMIHDCIGNNDKPIKLEKIIRFLDIHKEVSKINSNISLK